MARANSQGVKFSLNIVNSRLKASVLLIVTMMMVAVVTVLAKRTLEVVPPSQFLWLQMSFAALVLMVFTYGIRREALPRELPWSAWVLIGLLGICNFTLVKTFFTLSLEILPVTTHAYVINFVGITTMLMSAILLKERAGWFQILGALLAFVGIRIYFDQGIEAAQVKGLFFVGLTVFFLALTNILMRLLHLRFPQQISSNQVATIAVVVGGAPLFIYGVSEAAEVTSISLEDWQVIAANGVIGIALTMVVFNYSMRYLRAYEASILASSGLIFTAIFSVTLLQESISLNQVAGMALLLAGILVVQLKRPG